MSAPGASVRALLAAAAASTPAGSSAFPDVAATATEARLRRQLRALPPSRRRLLRLGVGALDALALARHRRRFAALAPEEADVLLERLARSRLPPLRRFAHVVRMLSRFAYFSGEEAHAAMDLDGPWLGRIPVEAEPPPRLERSPGR